MAISKISTVIAGLAGALPLNIAMLLTRRERCVPEPERAER